MSILTVNPVRKFETDTGAWPLLSVTGAIGVGANSVVLAAITGKKIRVMGWSAVSQGAAGSFQLLDGSGGTVIHHYRGFPALASGLNDDKPLADSGYCETTTGTGLYVTVVTAAVYLTVYYIAYTP